MLSNTTHRLLESFGIREHLSSGLYYIKVQMQGEQPMVQKLQIMQ